MTTHTICATCGTQYAGGPPPNGCAICNDERQYVGWDGQRWTDHDTLRRQHSLRIEEDDGLLAFGMTPGFAIDQRALLVPSVGGSILWECLPLVTDDAVAAIQARGGVRAIAISHPHFYGAMVDWSEALGGVPILTHEADRHWVQRPSPAIEHWSGDRLALAPDVTLIRCGGHFEGSTALLSHRGKGALLSGDALQVGLDRRHVSFMYSYPNLIP
ncbi:MAG: MBL fold metallo-hydrolase, partial [Myxococcales bacterium]|nr:MBL fold metallo-hydrolase [Myxococcales bacterium]